MKLVKRLLIIAAITVAILGILCVVVVGLLLGKVTKAAVEKIGPQVTKTPVRIEDVKISLFTGAVSMKKFSVGNPEGYTPTNAIYLGSASVSIDPKTVLSDKLVVKSIRIESPEIWLEGNPLGENNLKKLLENVTGGKQGEKPGSESPTSTKKIQINELVVTGGKVRLANGSTVSLPEIRLTNLGTGPEGITPLNLSKQILAQVLNDSLKGAVDGMVELGKSAEKLGKEAGEKITRGLGNLLKRSTN